MCVDPRSMFARRRFSCVRSCRRRRSRAEARNPSRRPRARPRRRPRRSRRPERASWYQECWGHFNNKAWDGFKACYADTVESDQVDSGQPHARGLEAMEASDKDLHRRLSRT